MFDINYYMFFEIQTNDYGVGALGSFIYDYKLACVYADHRPLKKILDFENFKTKYVLEAQSGHENDGDTEEFFLGSNVFVQRTEIDFLEYDATYTYKEKKIDLKGTNYVFSTFCAPCLLLYDPDPLSLSCYSFISEENIWNVTFDKYQQNRNQNPQFIHNKLTIVNLGYHTETRQGAIACLDLATGEQQWLTEFETPISNIQIVDGQRILAAHQGHIVELSPESGDILQKVDTELPESHKEGWDNLAIYVVFDQLFFLSSVDFTIAVFDAKTLEKKQVIPLPDYFGIYATHKPLIKDGRVYWSLRGGIQEAGRPCDYLLMELTPFSEAREPQVTMEEKPPVEVSVVQDGEHESYQIDLKADSPDQLIRFSEIEVQLVASNHGRTMWGAPALNKKFNGKIQLNTELPEGTSGEEVERATKYLHVFKEYWDKHTQEMGPKGSVKGSYIDVSCFLNGSKVA